MAYGYGDGGGGPTREMFENMRVMQATSRPAADAARHRQRLLRDAWKTGHHLPTWNGELYLELHRGTYTTQSRNKRANRKSEFLLHDAEFLASLARTLDTATAIPSGSLRGWGLVRLNQFHDIIPGFERQRGLRRVDGAVPADPEMGSRPRRGLRGDRQQGRRRCGGRQPDLVPPL